MKNTKIIKDVSYSLGVTAFKNGNKCVPAWDKVFLKTCLKNCKIGESIRYIDSWLAGWHDANLDRI